MDGIVHYQQFHLAWHFQRGPSDKKRGLEAAQQRLPLAGFYEQFLLIPQCFQKLSIIDASKWVSIE